MVQKMDWQAYSEELHRVIETPNYNIILDAERFYDPNTGEWNQIPGSVFQLTSGRYQRKFCSLWQLFDQLEFSTCIASLAQKVNEIRTQTSFSIIVTCTITAKHLMDSLH